MNLLLIMIKEIKHNVRNWKANIMMVLFPLILIVILGAAFSGVFDKTVTLDDIKVLYTNRGDGALPEGFNVFARELGKSGGVAFERTDSIEAGKKGVSEGEYSAYIVVDDKGGKIDIYKNDRYSFNANLVQSMVEAFARKYGVISAVAAVRPSAVGEIISRGYESYTALRSVDRNRQPGSLDYYSVTMLTLIILYASLTGFWGIKNEKNQKTSDRLLQGPVRKIQILSGKVAGAIIVTIIQIGVVILVCKYILKTNWGDDILTIGAILLSEAIMAVSLGTGLAYLIKNDGMANGILNTAIPVLAMFGGGYVPLSVMGGIFQKLSVISPVTWVNESIFRVIYSGDYSKVVAALLFNLALAAVFASIATTLSRKEV